MNKKKPFKASFFKSILSVVILIITGQAFFTNANAQYNLVSAAGTLVFKDANPLLTSNFTKDQRIIISAKKCQTQIINNF